MHLEFVLSFEAGELLDDLGEGLTSLSRKLGPLLGVLGLSLGDTLVPDDSGIDEGASHIQEVVLCVVADLIESAALVPAEDVEVVDGSVELALIAEHEIELVDNCNFEDDVLHRVGLDHSLELIDLGDELFAEAARVESYASVLIHAALDAREEMMRQVEVELHVRLVDEVRNVVKLVLERLLLLVETLPEVRVSSLSHGADHAHGE